MESTPPKMFADEVDIDVHLVGQLVAGQFPEWAGLALEPVFPRGTDNALFRLGDGLVVRLPRRERTSGTLERERRWLPVLAPHLPLAVPVPVAEGSPAHGYPFPWSVYTWLPGETLASTPPLDERRLALDLADFIAAWQAIDSTGGPPPSEENFFRGEPLARRDRAARTAIEALTGELDATAVTALWEDALRAPEWDRPPVWIHGDLDARNLLAANGRLTGVVDFGSVGVGDPACDVMVAWKVLSAESRAVFRDALGIDDATWERGRGWALSQAVVALAYYTEETNAVLVHEARRWLGELLG